MSPKPVSLKDIRYEFQREKARKMTVSEIDDILNKYRVPEAVRDEIVERLMKARSAP